MRTRLPAPATFWSAILLLIAATSCMSLAQSAVAQAPNPKTASKAAIDRLQILEAPAKRYRDTAAKPVATVPRDRDVHIYVEPRGLATKYEDGEVRAAMIFDLEVRAPGGAVLRSGKDLLRLPIAVKASSHLPLRDIYANIRLDPLNLEPGRYTLMVRVKDEFGGTAAEKTIDFSQTAAQVGGGPAKK